MIPWAIPVVILSSMLLEATVPAAAATARTLQAGPDSADLHEQARTLQARFERLRIRELPRTLSGGSHECDEIIGRLCVWDDGDDAYTPREESEAIRSARVDFLAALDSLAEAVPGDHWIFGQRIRYLVEADRAKDAEALSVVCRLPERWRCDAYLGYSRYHLEAIPSAQTAFEEALQAMPADLRTQWTDPGPLLDADLSDWIDLQGDSALAAAHLWTLADALFLAAGNDRWTGHLSRWVYAMSSDRARNPHGLRWGDDMTEATIRYGWPVAWERSWPRAGQRSFSVTGRDQPAAARTFPPAAVLDRGEEDAVVWQIPDGHARSTHLPPFLDSIVHLDGQVGRFWRREGVAIAAAWALPENSRLGGPEPVRENQSLEAGLFVAQAGAVVMDARTVAGARDTVRLSGIAPWSDWGIVSFEVLDADLRRAYRLRTGVGMRRVPPDVLSISDLMLLDDDVEPANFEEMLAVLRGTSEVAPGNHLGVAFEVYGLGFRSQVVGFNAWVERRGEGILSRAARWLGLTGPNQEVSIGWEEPGPSRPEPLFRSFRIGLPAVEAGDYDIVVEVSVPGRSPLVVRRSFRVR